MKITVAKAAHAEHIADFFRATQGPQGPNPELQAADQVEEMLLDEELSVIIASADRRIMGCGLGYPQAWNQSFEIGALAVDNIPERGQVGKALFEGLRRWGIKQYGLVYFLASTEATMKRAARIGASTWGFRPTAGTRELAKAQLIVGFYDPEFMLPRVQPPDNIITRAPLAAGIISQLADVADQHMPYPKTYPVGAPRGTGVPVISGQIWPSYHSRGNYVTLESAAGPFPIDIIRKFSEKVRQKGVKDIRLMLPVNQEQAFVDLLDFGFQPIAYLPGWYLRGSHRYDCVQMVSGLPYSIRGSSFMERMIPQILEGLTPNL